MLLGREKSAADSESATNRVFKTAPVNPTGRVQTGLLGPVPGQPSAATRFDRRETLRAAVFLWTTPLDTPRASSGCTRRSASAA